MYISCITNLINEHPFACKGSCLDIFIFIWISYILIYLIAPFVITINQHYHLKLYEYVGFLNSYKERLTTYNSKASWNIFCFYCIAYMQGWCLIISDNCSDINLRSFLKNENNNLFNQNYYWNMKPMTAIQKFLFF